MADGRMHTPHSTSLDPPLALAISYTTETIKRVCHISVTWHHYFVLLKGVKRRGAWHNGPSSLNTLMNAGYTLQFQLRFFGLTCYSFNALFSGLNLPVTSD